MEYEGYIKEGSKVFCLLPNHESVAITMGIMEEFINEKRIEFKGFIHDKRWSEKERAEKNTRLLGNFGNIQDYHYYDPTK